jgi:hypothetical protein
VARSWDAVSRRRQQDLFREIQRTDARIKKAVEQAAAEVARAIRGLPSENIGAVIRRAQYLQVRLSLIEQYNSLWQDEVGPSVLRGIAQSSADSILAQQRVMDMLFRAAPANAEAIANSMVWSSRHTLAGIRARYVNSIDLSSAVYRNAAFMSGKVDAVVDNGLLLGQSAREIADSVEKYIAPDVAGGTKYAAMRLGRTEINNAARTVTKESLQQQPYVEGAAWNLSGSHPEGDECDEFATQNQFGLGEGVWPADELPDAPHPQCFCNITSITPEPNQFIDNLLSGQYDCGGV